MNKQEIFQAITLSLIGTIQHNIDCQSRLRDYCKGASEDQIVEAAISARVSRNCFLEAKKLCEDLGVEKEFLELVATLSEANRKVEA